MADNTIIADQLNKEQKAIAETLTLCVDMSEERARGIARTILIDLFQAGITTVHSA